MAPALAGVIGAVTTLAVIAFVGIVLILIARVRKGSALQRRHHSWVEATANVSSSEWNSVYGIEARLGLCPKRE
jgi:ABC-type dipeptide/oligopeptide/nickel transport system permease subunit